MAARSVRKKDETESNFRVLVALVMILIQFAVIFAKISFALETIANARVRESAKKRSESLWHLTVLAIKMEIMKMRFRKVPLHDDTLGVRVHSSNSHSLRLKW